MTPDEVLDLVLESLDRHGVRAMVTGSFASNLHGIPRATFDADVVIEARREGLEAFAAEIADRFYVSVDAARDALRREGMFNVIHLATGFKIDLIVRKSRPFSREEFGRRRQVGGLGRERWVASPEDILLVKLEWAKLGGSERQFNDAASIARVQENRLDRAYLEKWGRELGVEDLLAKITRD